LFSCFKGFYVNKIIYRESNTDKSRAQKEFRLIFALIPFGFSGKFLRSVANTTRCSWLRNNYNQKSRADNAVSVSPMEGGKK